MMIKSVHVRKLFSEYDYDLDLCCPLTFIHSPNGMGKSTLMHMLYAALKGDMRYLTETPFERMEIWFDDDAIMVLQNYDGRLSVLMQKNEVDVPLTDADMADVCSCIYIPPERLAYRKSDGHLVPTLEAYAHELYARKLDFIKDAGFEPEIPARMKFPPSRYEISKDRQGYEELTASIDEYVRRNYVLAESVIIYKDIVNEIFINKSITVSDTGKLGVVMDNGMSLPLQRLSSGEKQILIMFFALLFHAEPGSVVVLDEPEISLHVSWQQKLGRYYADICRVRSIQMIVATHSPQVIHDMWEYARELRPSDA